MERIVQMDNSTKRISGSLKPHLNHLDNLKSPEQTIEILVEGEECPFCGFAKLRREGDEIVCPICGYGHRGCT